MTLSARGPDAAGGSPLLITKRGRPSGGGVRGAGEPVFRVHTLEDGIAALLIRIDDTDLIDDLCVHFTRSGFSVERAGGAMIDVRRADAPTREQERHEVLLHLRVWQVINPETHGEIVGP